MNTPPDKSLRSTLEEVFALIKQIPGKNLWEEEKLAEARITIKAALAQPSHAREPQSDETPITDSAALWLMAQGPLPEGWKCRPEQEGDIRQFDHELLGPCTEWKVVTAAVARRLERWLAEANAGKVSLTIMLAEEMASGVAATPITQCPDGQKCANTTTGQCWGRCMKTAILPPPHKLDTDWAAPFRSPPSAIVPSSDMVALAHTQIQSIVKPSEDAGCSCGPCKLAREVLRLAGVTTDGKADANGR